MKRQRNAPTLDGLVRPPIQDAGPSRTDKLCVPVYHTHGYRQYVGTCKVHADVDCRHLRAWKPAPQLAKTIMREWEESLDAVPASWRCKTCWPNAPRQDRRGATYPERGCSASGGEA